MTRFILFVLTLLLSAGSAVAAEFPKEFYGLWVTGPSCDAATGYAVFADDFGLTGTLTATAEGKFPVFGFGTDVIVDSGPNRMTVRYPFPENGGGTFEREIKDGRLYSHPPGNANQGTAAMHCDTIGAADPRAKPLLRLLGRLDGFVRAYSDIVAQCRTASADPKPCAAKIIALLDVNGDGKIAPAELTRFLRHYLPATLLFGDKDVVLRQGYRGVMIEADDLAAVEATAAVFGPFITNIVFSNFDYDGNGFLTVDEVALAVKEEGLPGGAGGVIRMLSQSRDQAEDALGALGGMAGALNKGGKQ